MSQHNLEEIGQEKEPPIAKIQKGRWQPSIILLEGEIANTVEAIRGHLDSISIKGYTIGESITYAEIDFPGHVHRPTHGPERETLLGRCTFDGRAIGHIVALTHFLNPKDELYSIPNHQSIEFWVPKVYQSLYPLNPQVKKQIYLPAQLEESVQPAQ